MAGIRRIFTFHETFVGLRLECWLARLLPISKVSVFDYWIPRKLLQKVVFAHQDNALFGDAGGGLTRRFAWEVYTSLLKFRNVRDMGDEFLSVE